jgi:hypothetical protein
MNWRRPSMEDDLKILKVYYLSNHWSDLPKILNLCLGDWTKVKDCLKWGQTHIEDDLKILKRRLEMKTTSNGRWPQNIKSWLSHQPLIGSSSNFKLILRGPNQYKKIALNKEELQWKMTCRYKKLNISATTDLIFLKLESYT